MVYIMEKRKMIGFFLATEKGYFCLKRCIEAGYGRNISFVVTFKETGVEKSYHEEIQKLCISQNIRIFLWNDIKDNIIERCEEFDIAIMFAVGWRYLLPVKINETALHGLIVFHDSLLPKYRGFSPTPTAIMCGEKKIGVTALKASDQADRGDIILQMEMIVEEEDYICDIIKKQCVIYAEMLMEILRKVKEGELIGKKQEEDQAVYCIWRDVQDCKIDWEMPAADIRNMVRAVSSPYPGAYCYYKKKKIIINRVEMTGDLKFAIRQCGKIWSVKNNEPVVICGNGMLKITDAKYEDGKTVIFDKLRERLVYV